MQAIQTKYFGPTNFRGARIKAKCEALSRTYHYDHSLNLQENHEVAAKMLQAELGWEGFFETGGLPNGDYCHVFRRKNLAKEVLKWASESRDHGGNPYCYEFVRLAQTIAGQS